MSCVVQMHDCAVTAMQCRQLQHDADGEGQCHVLLHQQCEGGIFQLVKESDTDKFRRQEEATVMLGTMQPIFTEVSIPEQNSWPVLDE